MPRQQGQQFAPAAQFEPVVDAADVGVEGRRREPSRPGLGSSEFISAPIR